MNGMITHWARVVTTIKNSLLRPPQGATPDSVSTLLPLQPPHSKHPRHPGLTSLLLLMGLLFTSLAHALDKVTYYHLDALGSPVAASDEHGNVIWRKDYQPYGEETQTPAQTNPDTRGYTGHSYDANSGLVYMGARWYSPLAGRFMALDPQGFSSANPKSFNRYAYADNNPYKYVDPDGREVKISAHVAASPLGYLTPINSFHFSLVLIPDNPADFGNRTGWQPGADGKISATISGQPFSKAERTEFSG